MKSETLEANREANETQQTQLFFWHEQDCAMKIRYKAVHIEPVSKKPVRETDRTQGRAEQPQEWQRSHMTIRQSIVAIMLALVFAGFLLVRLLIRTGVIGVMTRWKLYALLFVVTSLVGLLSMSCGGPSQ